MKNYSIVKYLFGMVMAATSVTVCGLSGAATRDVHGDVENIVLRNEELGKTVNIVSTSRHGRCKEKDDPQFLQQRLMFATVPGKGFKAFERCQESYKQYIRSLDKKARELWEEITTCEQPTAVLFNQDFGRVRGLLPLVNAICESQNVEADWVFKPELPGLVAEYAQQALQDKSLPDSLSFSYAAGTIEYFHYCVFCRLKVRAMEVFLSATDANYIKELNKFGGELRLMEALKAIQLERLKINESDKKKWGTDWVKCCTSNRVLNMAKRYFSTAPTMNVLGTSTISLVKAAIDSCRGENGERGAIESLQSLGNDLFIDLYFWEVLHFIRTLEADVAYVFIRKPLSDFLVKELVDYWGFERVATD